MKRLEPNSRLNFVQKTYKYLSCDLSHCVEDAQVENDIELFIHACGKTGRIRNSP